MKTVLLLLILSCPVYGQQVLFDSAAAGGTGNEVTQTFSITVGNNANRNLVIFWGGSRGSGDCSVTSADFNGDAATLIGASGVSTAARVEAWRVTAPDIGTFTVTINTDCSGLSNFARSGAISSYTSHQSVPVGTPTTTTTTSGTTVTHATASNALDLVVDAVMWEFDPSVITIGAGQTERVDLGFRLKASSEPGGPSTTTMSWTTAANEGTYVSAAHVSVAIKALGGTPNTLMFLGVGN